MGKDIEVLKECGVAYEVLDADGCARIEPALKKAEPRLSSIYIRPEKASDAVSDGAVGQ